MGATILLNPSLGYENVFAGNFDVIPNDRIEVSEENYNLNFIKATWKGSNWIEGATPQEISEYNALKVPKEVPNMNFRLALIHFGIFPSIIDTAFAYMENSTEREEYIALWNTANTMERDSLELINMAQEFGINSTQLDEIFKYANTL